VSNSPPGGIELLKKLFGDKPKRQFRVDEMKKAPVWIGEQNSAKKSR